MEFLLLLAVPTALVWGAVILNQQMKTRARLLPMIGLGVVLVGSVFGYEFFHLAGGPVPITLDRLLLGGLAGLFAIFWLRGSEGLGALNRADVVILLLMAVMAYSTLTHDWRFMKKMPASRLLFFYFVPLLLYMIMRSAKLGISDLKWITLSFAGLAVYLALTAIAETREMTALVFPRYIMTTTEMEFLGRGRGPFLNPVSNGIFQVVGLCSLWCWWPGARSRVRVIIFVLTGVMILGIFSTLTRSVWLGLFLSCGWFVWYPASRQMRGLLVVLGVVAFVVAFPVVGEKIFSFKRDKEVSQADMENSAQLRPLFVIVAKNMFKERPIFGCGFGQYAREKYPYLQDPYSGRPLSTTKTFMQHNIFLAYLTETGLVGLAILSLMLLSTGLISWKIWSDPTLDIAARQFGLLMVVMITNYCVNGMFHDVSIIPMANTLFYFLFGIVNNIHSAPAGFKATVEVREGRKFDAPIKIRRREPSTLGAPAVEKIVPTTSAKLQN